MKHLLLMSILLMPFQTYGGSQKPEYLIAVFGDSGTRATVADSVVGFPGQNFRLSLMQSLMTSTMKGFPEVSHERSYFINMNRDYQFLARDHLSAFLGNQTYSIPSKIRQKTSRRVRIANAALLAGSYRSSVFQREIIEDSYNKVNRKADMVIINYSGLDFARGETLSDFSDLVSQHFEWVRDHHPQKPILITKFPDIVSLMTRADQISLPDGYIGKAMTCQDLMTKMKFGGEVKLHPKSPPSEVQKASAKLAKMNQIIESKATDLLGYQAGSGKVSILDNNPPEKRWQDYLAADCVHPNQFAQRYLAELSWAELSKHIQ